MRVEQSKIEPRGADPNLHDALYLRYAGLCFVGRMGPTGIFYVARSTYERGGLVCFITFE